MILITKTFEKILSKIKSVSLDDVILEIYKHKKWLNNFKDIWVLKSQIFKKNRATSRDCLCGIHF